MKIKFIISMLAIIVVTASCKKSSNNGITLALTSISFPAINNCNIGTYVGSSNVMSFSVSDPTNQLTTGNWTLTEQVSSQSSVIINNAAKNGGIITFTGCLRFGTNSNIPATYYITTTAGLKSNKVNANFVKPSGAQ